MVSIPINREVLVWAREQRGLSPEDAAERLNMPVGDLLELKGERDRQPWASWNG